MTHPLSRHTLGRLAGTLLVAAGLLVGVDVPAAAADPPPATRQLYGTTIDSPTAGYSLRLDTSLLPSAVGTHTMELKVGQQLARRRDTYYTDTCTRGGPSPIYDPTGIEVGWTQIEHDGDPCVAQTNQVAVRFDTASLDRIPAKVIDRAVLAYDERPSQGCPSGTTVLVPGMPVPDCARRTSTWTNGDGVPENKPNGCVVVRIPSVDWVAAAPQGTDIPSLSHPSGRPAVKRLTARAWDVTEPYRWQTDPSAMPLQAPGSPPLSKGYGFLLTGELLLHQLEAEDNTRCVSQLTNIRLLVTYTVFPDQPLPQPR